MKVTEITAIIGSVVSILQLIFIGVLTFLAYKTNKKHNDFAIWEKQLELKPDIKLEGIYLGKANKEWGGYCRYIVLSQDYDDYEYEVTRIEFIQNDYKKKTNLKSYLIVKSQAEYFFDHKDKVELVKTDKNHIILSLCSKVSNARYSNVVIYYGILKLVFKNIGNSFDKIRLDGISIKDIYGNVKYLQGVGSDFICEVDKNNQFYFDLTLAFYSQYNLLLINDYEREDRIEGTAKESNLLESKQKNLFLAYNTITASFSLTNRYGDWHYNMIIEKKDNKSAPHISVKNIN